MYSITTRGIGLVFAAFGAFQAKLYFNKKHVYASSDPTTNTIYQQRLPNRDDLLNALKDKTQEYDILVIGGGATGCGVALDACTRGLKTALVEKFDYSSGTSSRSTKLVHGGVRYLQNAILKLDREQYQLVKEALHERANLLAIAPHIAKPLPIMLPVYKWWQVPYFWVGIKMYDLVAGRQLVKSSYFLGKNKALDAFPMLKSDKLCGAIVYYDGQQDDSRMNLSISLSAIRNGATCINHVEVVHLLFAKVKDDDREVDKVCGAHVRDMFTGDEWDVHAKCVINATGPYTDAVRKMGNKDEKKICQPASGVHIILPEYYSPKKMGLLDPSTSDGRVIFFLPWEGKTIAGTTDRKCDVTFTPEATEDEIQFILNEIKNYLDPGVHVRRGDVLSAWSGIRPLIRDPASTNTKSVSRNHVINVSENNLVTIAGGKWTTYRSMAEDTVDAAIKACNLTPSRKSITDGLMLEGAVGWTPMHFIGLVQKFGLEPEVAEHLSHAYGVNAPSVAKLAALTGKRWPVVGLRLVEDFPFIEADVLYAVRHEYACSAVDVIAHRLRLAFLNVRAADEALPKVVRIMADELGWDKSRQMKEIEEARIFLQRMGFKNNFESVSLLHDASNDEVETFASIFKQFDTQKTGHITGCQLKEMFKTIGNTDITDAEIQRIISEIDLNKNSTLEFNEFLQLMMSMKKGVISNNSLGLMVQKYYMSHLEES